MATIAIKILNFTGICTITGHVGQCDAFSIRETVDLPKENSSGDSSSSTSTARFSDIQVTRYRDKASPKFAGAVSSASDLGTVNIYLFDAAKSKYFEYELSGTYVSRVEYETLDEERNALGPHMNVTALSHALPPAEAGMPGLYGSALANRAAQVREAPRPVFGTPRGPATEDEIERIWFNARQVAWKYCGGADNIEKTYNLQTGILT